MGAKHYSPETWATIEGLYESSRFSSIEKLHQHCTKIFKRCPSKDSIKKRFAKRQPDKRKSEDQFKEAERKKYSEIFAELGVGRVETARIIHQGIMSGPLLMEKALKLMEKDGPLSEDLLNQIKEMYTGWGTTWRFIRERNKLTGDYSPERVKVSGKVKTSSPLDDMSEEELRAELDRMEKNRER